ncbi:MAG: hypothetical protein MASP_01125 [Candidatus Methanolliviera sp. GoM_asphalt]|nr:MAG: hypothetical protein MASP_01125 [Candidatus Methanolliviera sp. GoM_asphalt]
MIGQIKRVKDRYKGDLLSYRGVVGIGIGYKVINGRETDQLSIVISVERKLPLNELRENEILPREIGGVSTDIQEVGKIKALEVK